MFGKKISVELLTLCAVVIGAALVFFFRAGGLAHSVLPDPVKDKINSQVAGLVSGRPHVELTSQKAARARAAIKNGDYAEAQKIGDEVFARSKMQSWHFTPFNRFFTAALDMDDPAFGERLNAWVAQSGQAFLPHFLRAEYLLEVAWRKRGERTAAKTEASRFQVFDSYLAHALADVDTVIKIDAKNPMGYFLRLEILNGHGNSPEAEAAFEDGISKFPAYYGLYKLRMYSLAPKWGGSVNDMYEFVEKFAASASKDSPLKMLYIELYNGLLDAASFSCSDIEGEAKKGCLVAAMASMQRPELDKGLKEAIDLYDSAERYQYNQFILENLGTAVDSSRVDNYARDFVEMAAEKTGSDNQLVETNPGNNDYIFDLLTGWGWYRAGNWESAEKKYNEALLDLGTAHFPGEEEQDIDLATIYSDLGDLYETKAQFANSIIYRTAARVISGGSYDSLGACYGYFKLMDYPAAVDACTRIIGTSDDFGAHLWRGMSYKELGDTAAEEKDLRAVADSDWDVPNRSWAASFVDGILGSRGDLEGMLKFFEDHPYRFDEKGQSKNNLSVTYNNRCYAYMHLGQLQKALDDCNKSLTFDNLPDAVVKRREIMQRLKVHEKGI